MEMGRLSISGRGSMEVKRVYRKQLAACVTARLAGVVAVPVNRLVPSCARRFTRKRGSPLWRHTLNGKPRFFSNLRIVAFVHTLAMCVLLPSRTSLGTQDTEEPLNETSHFTRCNRGRAGTIRAFCSRQQQQPLLQWSQLWKDHDHQYLKWRKGRHHDDWGLHDPSQSEQRLFLQRFSRIADFELLRGDS